jgi:hypothetical protein
VRRLFVTPRNNLMGKKTMLSGLAILVLLGGVGLSLKPTKAAPASSQTVTVDSITWQILSSDTARRIENQYLGSTAKGIYLMVNIAATNSTYQSVRLSNDQAELEVKGTTYPPDPSALTALELGGHNTLSTTDLGPTTTATGWVAYDVPPSALRSNPHLCIHETAPASITRCMPANT